MLRCLMLTAVGAAGVAPGMLTGEMKFTMTEANKLVRLAQISYCEPHVSSAADVLDWSCQSCKDSGVSVVPGSVRFVHGDDSNNSQAVVGKLALQPGCFIAFRGSHTKDNWMKDFQIWYHDEVLETYPHCDGCKVHEGFYKVWENLRDDINRELDVIGCKDESGDPVYITGHSLGGALAHLAAFTLQDRGYKIALMYSFEAPRVGNDKFAAEYNRVFGEEAPCFRVTHGHDPVVHVPAEFSGFVHVNTEVYFGDSGSNFRVCPKTEDPDGSNQHSNVPWDMFYVSQHCGAPAFGDGFDICSPVCSAPKSGDIVV